MCPGCQLWPQPNSHSTEKRPSRVAGFTLSNAFQRDFFPCANKNSRSIGVASCRESTFDDLIIDVPSIWHRWALLEPSFPLADHSARRNVPQKLPQSPRTALVRRVLLNRPHPTCHDLAFPPTPSSPQTLDTSPSHLLHLSPCTVKQQLRPGKLLRAATFPSPIQRTRMDASDPAEFPSETRTMTMFPLE